LLCWDRHLRWQKVTGRIFDMIAEILGTTALTAGMTGATFTATGAT
jgi:hypothetical protein